MVVGPENCALGDNTYKRSVRPKAVNNALPLKDDNMGITGIGTIRFMPLLTMSYSSSAGT